MNFRLIPYTLHGYPCARPEALIEVLTAQHDFIQVRFLIDTGSDFSMIPIPRAEDLEIPIVNLHKIPVASSVGTGVGYLDRVTVRISGEELVWPCVFTEQPIARPSRPLYRRLTQLFTRRRTPGAHIRRRLPPSVLGRAGFLEACDIAINATDLIIERRRPQTTHSL